MECECPASFFLSGTTNPQECIACPNTGEAPTLIQDSCITCLAGNVDVADNCTCAVNKYNSEFMSGTTRQIRCQNCPAGYYSTPLENILYNCTICPARGQVIDTTTGECACTAPLELQGSFCVDATDFAAVVTTLFNPSSGIDVRYSNVIVDGEFGGTGRVTISDTMQYLQPQALYECLKFKYYKQCQILANLCVLHMYREGATPCAALVSLANATSSVQNSFYDDDGWKEGLPWLYYDRTGTEVIQQRNRIKAKMTLDPDNASESRYAHIPYKLAKYSLEGEFIGWEDLSTQIWLCPMTQDNSKRWRRVGLSLRNFCDFDLYNLIDQYIHVENMNYFFELFIEDYNGDLIDVPVLIDNFVDAGLTYPNRAADTDESDKFRFVRRFFLYENISAIEGEGEYLNPTKPPAYVRFIHEARLVYELDTETDETMYVPYLHLIYRSLPTTDVTGSYPTPMVHVTVWKMDTAHSVNVIIAFFIVMHVLAVIWVIWRIYKWVMLHPQNMESTEFVFYIGRRIIYEVMTAWSTLAFWFLFITTLVYLIFFKFESAFYILLPDNYQWAPLYRSFEIVFGIMICLKFLVIWSKIWYQCNIDIFFLDKERVKDDPRTSPNAWRLIFVANEFNEMQNMQYISIEFTLFWFVFFMEGEGWEGWSAHDPDFTANIDDSLYNHYLKFCITVITLIIIGFVQYIMRLVFSFIISLPYQDFVDLCSVTNISVFIFDERVHGYYIHGESTGGQADVSAKELKGYLDKEERGESRYRGLVAEYPNLQTFEIYLPLKVRQIYEVVYKQPVLNEISNFRQNISALQNTSRLFTLNALPKGLNIQALVNQRDEVSQYFMNYISQVKNYPSVALKDRGFCQTFSNLPPGRLKTMELPLFLKDRWYSFKNVFFCALDLDLLILFACIYTILDIWLLNFLQSTIIIYTFYKL